MKLLSIVSTALLVAGAATASSGFDDNVDKLLLVSRQNGAVSQEKQDALAERYLLDHPGGEEFEEEHERAMGRRGVQDRILTAKRHQHIARHQKKQCKSKGKGAKKQQQHKSDEHKSSAANAGQQSYKQQSSSQHHQHGDKKKSGKSDDGDGNGDSDGSKKSKHGGSSSSNSHSHSGSDVNGGKGLFGMSFEGSQCSSPDASEQHPNGSPGFLTCGISKSNRNSKWNPPNVKLSDIKMISADKAAQSDVFKPCAKYKSTFEQVSQEVGIPAVLLMSFALQESTCNAGLTGANGEIGISQITPDKCGGAPGGNCHDVHFNLKTAANYFKNTLDNQCNGNALCAAGQYNGWQANKMTYASATNQQYGCMAQNNLDYLNQLFNGFCQGKSGYSGEFAMYSNIAHC